MRVVRTSNIELLVFAALTSQQWPVKVQAARAIGTVATKLDTIIQTRLVSLLLAGLEGRTNSDRQSHRQGVCLFVSSRFDDIDISLNFLHAGQP